MTLLICQHCGRASSAEAKFCSDCGTALPRRECPSCHAVNDHIAPQCDACGAPMDASLSTEQPAEPPSGEPPAGPQVEPLSSEPWDGPPSSESPAGPPSGEISTPEDGEAPVEPASSTAPTASDGSAASATTPAADVSQGDAAQDAPAKVVDAEASRAARAILAEMAASLPTAPATDVATATAVETGGPPEEADRSPAADPQLGGGSAASPEPAHEPAQAAIMPLQQLAERGDLRPVLVMEAAPPGPQDQAAAPAQTAQIVVPAAEPIQIEIALPAREDPPYPPAGLHGGDAAGAAWPDGPPPGARRAWIGPFFYGLGAVAVVTFASLAVMRWSSSSAPAQASAMRTQPSAEASRPAAGPAVDAAADAAAEAAARLLASTPERPAAPTRRPDAVTPTQAAASLGATMTRPAARATPAARPADTAIAGAATPAPSPAPPRAQPAAAAPPEVLAAPLPQLAESPRPRARPAPPPPPALPRECTAAMDALGLCQTSSKPNGS